MRTVNAMAWNKKNDDMLVVAYGSANGPQQGLNNGARLNQKTQTIGSSAAFSADGLVLCWSLKNPEYPERIYKCSSPATAIDFSIQQPSLMAVGYADGSISVLDVRDEAPNRLLETEYG
jgi:WD40 repeat protein